MEHTNSIKGVAIRSCRDFIVYSDEMGVIGEHNLLAEAKRALEREEAKCREWGVEPHLMIFQWSEGQWRPAISLYELQEDDVRRNPSCVVHYP
jgi:hypothetical protein